MESATSRLASSHMERWTMASLDRALIPFSMLTYKSRARDRKEYGFWPIVVAPITDWCIDNLRGDSLEASPRMLEIVVEEPGGRDATATRTRITCISKQMLANEVFERASSNDALINGKKRANVSDM